MPEPPPEAVRLRDRLLTVYATDCTAGPGGKHVVVMDRFGDFYCVHCALRCPAAPS